VSCYATSLTALRQAVMVPAPPVPAPGGADTQPALVVAMPSTPSLGPPGDLPAAVAECDLVSGYLPGTVRLVGPEATRSSTMAALRDSAIAHLACHAVSEPDDPSRGRILVHDGALTVAELQALPIWRRSLAFLSACNTADASGGIPDEAIHLASALQVIGFEHVIGTTWQVPDDLALAVTGRFYAAPAGRGDPDDFAAALHASVAAVLVDDPLNPFPWTYVLYGAVSGG
jgi:CHAT domain-containing protein